MAQASASMWTDGETFGKYKLVATISAGGMAELFLAVQAGMEGFTKVVALKRILPEMANSPESLNMFLDEARLVARLDHPNIVRIYDLGEVSGQYFICMEYLAGEDLARALRLAKVHDVLIDVNLVAFIIQQAAEGLHYAHESTDDQGRPLNLVHRDITPSNIIVTFLGQLKIVDFGIAKASINQDKTQVGTLKGKIAYLSPEQIKHEPVDRRCDVFQLGIVMWEMLTGKKLFLRDTEVATLQAVHKTHVPLVRHLRPEVPAELEAIVTKALSADPKDRFQTAGEFADALDEYFRSQSTRPTARSLASWLETLFGSNRANAKKSIAKGANLESSITEVMKPLPSISTLKRESTEIDAHFEIMTDPEARRAQARKRNSLYWKLGIGFIGAFAVLFAVNHHSPWTGNALKLRAAPLTGSLFVESLPAGAFIFLGDEPTGRSTPATLEGLIPSKAVQLRIEKMGYLPTRDSVAIQAGKRLEKSFVLEPRMGKVKLVSVKEGVDISVDGNSHLAAESLSLRPGKHFVELKVNGKIVARRTVDVHEGPQVIEMGK